MPTKPEPDSAPAADDTPKKTTTPAAEPKQTNAPEVPEGRLPAGVYEFTGTIPTHYLDVPLTARPADPGQPAEGDDPGTPAVPATVFDWAFSAPHDGRWQPSKKKPNQKPDNAGADPEE
jgi:hypothetical protein